MPEPAAQSARSKQDLIGSSVGRYIIREQAGAGGMGEVYRAEDTVLKRSVALKRIAPALSHDVSYRDRLLKEAERASSLSHPNVAAVYDVFEERGELFVVMEYVQGITLRHRLAAPVPIDEFLQIAKQCVQGLAAAHANGLLHGDIKPENVMITASGTVKILDFGLARRLPKPETPTNENPTSSTTHVVSGTPAYMSPETLMEKLPDQRSDIFSLGVVFYEVLTRVCPFRGRSFVETTDYILHKTPAPIRQLNRAIPPLLERVVNDMLQKDPQQRYSTAEQVATDLNRVPVETRPVWIKAVVYATTAVLAIVLIVVFAPLLRRAKRLGPAEVQAHTRNLAVLPFRAVAEDQNTKAFCNGLMETLTAKLTQLGERYPVQVVPPSEVRAQAVDSADKANAVLGANLVLEGSLQVSGKMMRVTYNLVDAEQHRQVRAGTITESASDPFAVEDRVVDSVLNSLDLELAASDRNALSARGTTEPAAYDFYLQGRGYLQEYEKPENVDSAIAVFNSALQRDPNYALAYSGLGESYWHKYEQTRTADWITKATDACNQAVHLAPSNYAGYTCLGMVYNQTGRYEQAIVQFQRAVEYNGTSDDAYRGLAYAYEHVNKFGEAESTYRRAIRLRPQYWAGYNWMGSFLVRRGRYGEAEQMFQRVVELAPDSFRGYYNMGGVMILLGRYQEAVNVLNKSISIRPSASALTNRGTAHFYLRQFDDAASDFAEALKMDKRSTFIGNLAEAYYWEPGRRTLGIATFKDAILKTEAELKINPHDGTLLSHASFYCAMVGYNDCAMQYARQALQTSSSDPEVNFWTALTQAQLHHDSEALDYLRKAMALGLDPNRPLRNPIFDRFDSNPQFKQILLHTAKSPAK